jgi:drug/metabolite transporter (DMT)-like permease
VSRRESAPPEAGAARTPSTAARHAELAFVGSACAVAAGLGFGTLGVFSRLFYDAGGEEFTLLILRFTLGAAILVAVALLRFRPLPSVSDAAFAVLLGLPTLAAVFCLLAGFATASPGLVTLLFYIYPLITTVAAHELFGEELTRGRLVLLGIGMAGIALTVGVPSGATAAGIAWGLGAGICVSVYILGGRHVMSRTADSFQFVALSFTGAVVMLAPVAAVVGVSAPPADALGYGLYAVTLGAVLPTLLFYFAVPRIGAGGTSRLAAIEPVTAVVLSYVVLGDGMTTGQIVGGALVVTAVILLAAPAMRLRRRGARTATP